MPAPSNDLGVTSVIATRNRSDSLARTLENLLAAGEVSHVIVVDNASDGGARKIRRAFPEVEVIRLDHNIGAAARNVGVAAARTPYVAFSDDDSWWARGAVGTAIAALEEHSRIAVIAPRILVGPDARPDPTCAHMAATPRVDDDAPGKPVLGFLGCAAVVRRSAFLEVGGFHPRLGIGGEEELVAIDLAAKGWMLRYLPMIDAHHHPSNARDASRRRYVVARNGLWVALLRFSRRGITARARRAARELDLPGALRVAAETATAMPWLLPDRRPVTNGLEDRVLQLETDGAEEDPPARPGYSG